VWYEPEAIAGVDAALTFAADGRSGDLDLAATIGKLPAGLDPESTALVVRLADDDTIHQVTLPAGSFHPTDAAGRFTADGGAGFDSALLEIAAGGAARLEIHAARIDLSRAARTDHMLTVTVEVGTYASSHTRLWTLDGNRLVVGDR
jgi:hypothetical protein